ncbi:PD-(D/E)XK nuclease family protein [Candidatus Dojkabacteria bacterium]|jgi:hypothetical protein|nr:PD-(D/E)XK nuclease family protein [Candidatus Dojkabacteria bacterium]
MSKLTAKKAEAAIKKKNKAHQSYYSSSGEKLPSVTGILSANLGWNTQVLVAWARREALLGNDPDLIRDSAANIGSLIHTLVEHNLLGKVCDVTTYSPAELAIAEVAMQAFHKWKTENQPEVIAVELQMVSDEYRFGGTVDLVCNINNRPVLVDWKSGSIYQEHLIQGGALTRLVWEQYPDVFDWNNPLTWPDYHAIGLDKKTGNLLEHIYTGETILKAWEAFEHLLALHNLKKLLIK